jgi:hypothetical protein
MDPSTQMQEMLLSRLRDIHLPTAISWWPPAPGWWVVAGLLVIILAGSTLLLLRRWQAGQYRREAGEALAGMYVRWNDDQLTDQYLINAGRILRQVAVHVCGRPAVSSATGEKWINELDGMSTRPMPDSLGSALTQSAYQPNPRLNVDQAHQDILDWLQGVSSRQYRKARKTVTGSPRPHSTHKQQAHV